VHMQVCTLHRCVDISIHICVQAPLSPLANYSSFWYRCTPNIFVFISSSYTILKLIAVHGVLEVSPGVVARLLEGPKNPDGLDFGIYVFVYMYKVHMFVYMLGGGM